MPDCDGFFGDLPFRPEFQDEAIRLVRTADFYDPAYKKFLIQCWFDTTYGEWNGSRFDLKTSRDEMAKYLRSTAYRSYEEMLTDSPPEP